MDELNTINGMNIMQENEAYKLSLRESREVQNLNNEIEVNNVNSIIQFGQKSSESISRISDELLGSMREVKAEEAGEMLVNLTKIMDRFDIKEFDQQNQGKKGLLAKLFKSAEDTIASLFNKYDSMGQEIEKVYVLLKRYEGEIKESNVKLEKLYKGNLEYYQQLEKYIVAGELALEEIDMYIEQFSNDASMSYDEKQMMIQKLNVCKEMLNQRLYDLRIAENIAIQSAPMIEAMTVSNFNLLRKINTSFIITLPIFKQCLAQAIMLKRQEIQAKSLKQLDDKTNELIMRNAEATARQSVEIAKMSSGSVVAIETLEKSYQTIMKGIEDTKMIQEENKNKRVENTKRLEEIKTSIKYR